MTGSGEIIIEQLQNDIVLLRQELSGLQAQNSIFQEQLSGQHQLLVQEVRDDFRHIVDYANDGVGSMLAVFSIIFGVLGVGFGVWFHTLNDNIKKSKEDVEKADIKTRNLIVESTKKQNELENSIESQDGRVFDHVMERFADYWFGRVAKNIGDLTNLEYNISTIPKHIIHENKNFYQICLNLYETHKKPIGIVWAYQFFPCQLFLERKIGLRVPLIGKVIDHQYYTHFSYEIVDSSVDIINTYKSNPDSELKNELEIYLKAINEKILVENIWKYTPLEQSEILKTIQEKMTNIGELQLRESIKNPPKVEIIEGNTVEQK